MRAHWMANAFTELENGVVEVRGGKHNLRILEYLETCKGEITQGDETPWCSAFVNWVMRQGWIQGTDSLAARSWLTWGSRLQVPEFGAVGVLWRESPDSWKGHVGFVLGATDQDVYLLGGNQGNAVSIRAYSRRRVLDWRYPA